MERRLRILHLSDLHMGQERGAGRWRLRDVLGDAWRDNLDAIAADGPVDLVCFTGDLAFSGQPEQYLEAGQAIAHILQRLGLDKSRFFCVPGNHDIDRNIEKDAWRRLRDANDVRPEDFDPWIAGGRTPRGCDDGWRDAVLLRRRAYDDWLTAFGLDRLRPKHHRHGRLGYRISFAPGEIGNPAPLHIVGFDSAWLAGDGDEREQDNANLRLTREQVGRLMSDDNGEPLPGHAIGLVHHPFSNLIEHESQSMPVLMSRLGLGLLLHGHLHDLRLSRWSDPDRGLHVSSAGSQYQRNDLPNTIHLLDVELPAAAPLRPVRLWVRAWDGDGGHWYSDNRRYKGMVDGRLRLGPDEPQRAVPAQDKLIGRIPELDQLRAALLPAARGEDSRPTVICCAIDGMPGVGKTRLAEAFIAKDWREALGLPEHTPPAELRVHLALAPDDRRDAESLAAAVLSAYQRAAPPGAACAMLRDLLRSGPGGRRLLLIENVDAPAQAEAVAALVAQLPGCAVLATARYRDLAGGDWSRVPVAPLPREKSIELLRQRIGRGRNPYTLNDAEADALAKRMGDLPLALQIAGSHLGRGTTPQRFLKLLEAERLALGPVAAGDRRFDSDAARGLIAGAFAISWALWCGEHDARWQDALVSLAHGPAEGVGHSLGVAMTALDTDAYEDCVTAADGLSLLDVELVQRDGQPPQRRVRLHPLIAEFLRHQPGPDEATVMGRISGWCGVHLQEEDSEAMPAAWAALRAETPALSHWLTRTPLPPEAVAIGASAILYAQSHGPYKKWLDAIGRWAVRCEDQYLLGTLRLAESRLSSRAGDPVRSEAAVRAALTAFQQADRILDIAIAHGQFADILQGRGELDEALRIHREEVLPVVDRLGDAKGRAVTQGKIAIILQARGELEEALRIHREEELPVYKRLGNMRACAIAHGRIANILQVRGELEEALRIRREDELPVYERLGDVRSRAITQGQIADILQARGELEEALRIRREEQMPVYERLGDVRSRAITQGKIADILQARGELEEALRIRREEVLPVVERLGDVRSRAITQGQIADILQARGELEEALRIRREDELPVYERLGDVRERAITQGQIADILQARGELEEALRIRREEVLPVVERLGDVHSLLVGRANLAMTLVQLGQPEDGPEIRTLLTQALADAERLRLPEAQTIREWIAEIFGPDDSSPEA